ncbi:MAG: hypothetical protein IAI49_10005, partial [Candidatus Eremiobacteraeota bacterium]|nr:hypothetical protein [Candidatus Eremiobacteraeota bacterium]
MRSPRLGCLAAALGLLGAAPRPIDGVFALQAAAVRTHGHLQATRAGSDPLTLGLDIWLTQGSSPQALAAYDVEMTKRLHTVVVSDDFSTFAHIHPALGKDGHFRIVQRFPKAGLYHIYADAVPHGVGQQVFRFDLTVGGRRDAVRRLGSSQLVSHAGPYTVLLDRTTLDARGENRLTVHIREQGRAARDLRPYLGVPAHAVFINASDLTYVHAHPVALGDHAGTGGMSAMAGMPGMRGMDMTGAGGAAATPLPENAPSSPDMLLHVA